MARAERFREEAALLLSGNQLEEARAKALAALEHLEKKFGDKSSRLHSTLTLLAFIDTARNDPESANNSLTRALRICAKTSLRGTAVEASSRLDAANNFFQLGQLTSGWSHLHRVEELLTKAAKSKNSGLRGPELIRISAFFHRIKASYSLSEFKLVDCEQDLLHSISFFERLSGKVSEDVARSLWDLGRVYIERTEYLSAEASLRRSLAMLERIYGRWHGEVGLLSLELSGLYLSIGSTERALVLGKKAAVCLNSVYGRFSLEYAQALQSIASVYDYIEDYKNAKNFLVKGLNAVETALGSEHEEVAMFLDQLSRILLELGQTGQAEDCAQRASKIRAQQAN